MCKKCNDRSIEIEEEETVYQDGLEVKLVGSPRQLKQALKTLKLGGYKWQTNGAAYPVKNKYGENAGKYSMVLKRFRQEDIEEAGAIFIIESDDD